MIEIRRIDALRRADIDLKNEPFSLFGRIAAEYDGGQWTYSLVRYAPENITEMCFPDENYDFDAMKDSVFLGAYDEGRCVGLAVLRQVGGQLDGQRAGHAEVGEQQFPLLRIQYFTTGPPGEANIF